MPNVRRIYERACREADAFEANAESSWPQLRPVWLELAAIWRGFAPRAKIGVPEAWRDVWMGPHAHVETYSIRAVPHAAFAEFRRELVASALNRAAAVENTRHWVRTAVDRMWASVDDDRVCLPCRPKRARIIDESRV